MWTEPCASAISAHVPRRYARPVKLRKPKIGPQSKYQVQDLITVLTVESSKRGGIAGPKTGEFQRRVCEETGMSKATFYELLKQGKGQRFRKEDDLCQVVQKVQYSLDTGLDWISDLPSPRAGKHSLALRH